MALARLRRRHRGRLVRPVPVLAARDRADREFGWQKALLIFAAARAADPAAVACRWRRRAWSHPGGGALATQSLRQALDEAFGHRSYVLLVLGFFTCGFQLFFITVHLPAYLIDRGLTADDGGWTLAAIGLFNIVGSLLAGWLGDKMPKRYLLSLIYFARSLAIVVFITLPASPASALALRRGHGPALAVDRAADQRLVAVMFGTRWLTMLAASPSSAIRSAASSASGSAACCSSAPAPTTWSGGASIALRRDFGADQPADRRKAGARARAMAAEPQTALRA